MNKYGISPLEIRRMELNRAMMAALEVIIDYQKSLNYLRKNGRRLDRDLFNPTFCKMTNKELENHCESKIKEIEQDNNKFNGELMDINKIINR